MYLPGDAICEVFVTEDADTSVASVPDATPAAALTRNGADDGAVTLIVANIDTGRYKVTGTIPGSYAIGDEVAITISVVTDLGTAKSVISLGQLSKSYYEAGDTICEVFITADADTHVAHVPDSTPTAALTHNGADDGAVTLTVANIDTGRYKVTGTIPGGYAYGDEVAVSISVVTDLGTAKETISLGQLGPPPAVATPTLAVSDAGNGTGGTATITTADAGSAIIVYSGEWDGEAGEVTWTQAGSRTGNGTVSVNPGSGFYWWKAVADGLIVSNLVYQNLTDDEAAIHYDCLLAVQARLQALLLDDVENSSVIIRKLPLDRKLGATDQPALPVVMIWPTRPTADPLAGNTSHDEYGYGVMVAFIAADNQESTFVAGLAQMLLWRQKAQRAFQNQRLVGVAGIVNARVEPQEVILPDAWEKNLRSGGLLLRFFSREERGLT